MSDIRTTPGPTEEGLKRYVEAYRQFGEKQAAGKSIGISEASARRWHRMATEKNLFAHVPEEYTPELATPEKPKVRVRAYNPNITRDHPTRKVLAIGDTHVKPGLDNRHFTWIGRYVAESRPENVISIGDFLDCESCEFHTAAGSKTHGSRPTIQDDIASGEDALDLYHREVGVGEIPHDIIYGNHEHRMERYEELAPNLTGTVCILRDQMFARYRWRWTPYRHWLFFEGVGFTHVPHTVMGKPIGGKFPENIIANEATHSIVFGHTHRYNHVTRAKIGVNNSVTITNVGSAMPHGYTPKYTDGVTTGYTYGIVELRLHGGRVESARLISLLELAERYA